MSKKSNGCKEAKEYIREKARACGFDPDKKSDIQKIRSLLKGEGCEVVRITVKRWFTFGEAFPDSGSFNMECLCKVLNADWQELDRICRKGAENENECKPYGFLDEKESRIPEGCFVAAKKAIERELLQKWIPENLALKSLVGNLYYEEWGSCSYAIRNTLYCAMSKAEYVKGVSFLPVLEFMRDTDWVRNLWHAPSYPDDEKDNEDMDVVDRFFDRIFRSIDRRRFKTREIPDDRRYGMFRYLSGCVSIVEKTGPLSEDEKFALLQLKYLLVTWNKGEGKNNDDVKTLHINEIIGYLVALYPYLNDNLVYWRCFVYLIHMLEENRVVFGYEENRTALYEAIMRMDRASCESEGQVGRIV